MLGRAPKEQKVGALVPQITYTTSMVSRAMHPSKDAHVPMPSICDSVALCGKWDLTDVIKGMDPEMGRLPWITQVESMGSQGPYKRMQHSPRREQ